jgi:hypothetical protein
MIPQSDPAADPLVREAIDAAFCVIQSAHDMENRFDSGTAGDLYAERFEQFQQLAAALAHYSAWEANRVAAAAANQA